MGGTILVPNETSDQNSIILYHKQPSQDSDIENISTLYKILKSGGEKNIDPNKLTPDDLRLLCCAKALMYHLLDIANSIEYMYKHNGSIEGIENAYTQNIPSSLEINENSIEELTKNKNIAFGNEKDSVRTFKWIGKNPKTQIEFLFQELSTEHGFIHENKFEEFKTAFSGANIFEPLNICWICLTRDKKYSSKSDLLSFIELLTADGFLNPGETSNTLILYKKIEFIFCDYKGKPFKNLRQSNAQKGESTLHNEIIKQIVARIPK